MQLIEAALAFAITMLALSLVVSSFVEIIHRICSMREAGLKYVLGQMFDQVIKKHLTDDKLLAWSTARGPRSQMNASHAKGSEDISRQLCRTDERQPRADGRCAESDPTTQAENALARVACLIVCKRLRADPRKRLVHFWKNSVRLWNGRDLAAMTPAEFMERLGSMDVGQAIADANIGGHQGR